MTELSGKIVAVTGCASGIGRALAFDLATRGAHVAISDVNEAGLRETAELLRGQGKVTSHLVDVRSREAVERFAADVEAQHGGCDVIINNAGVTVRASLEEISYEDFQFVIDVNLYGVVHGIKSFLPLFRKRGAGHFVNISSINAMVPFALNGPYNASKYAVLGLSETLFQEFRGTDIRTTCVHPGGIKTNIVRNSRGASKGDAAMFDRIAMTTAQGAAKTILDGVERNKQRVYVGLDAKFMAAAKRVVPDIMVQVAGAATRERRGRAKAH
jgi:NAD(P)-dependent dehydrogenase (short-subunit alcohol dehydrogenase family)